ncbi:MAG: phospholipase [Bacteroidales bacterium]|nr:phospholipase [Bacteroidales bacterium]
MPPLKKINIVFVHGYSVTNLNTYGELPLRLKAEGANREFEVNVEEIYLGKYISFSDEVKLDDISRAFESAVRDQLSHLLDKQERFACITHSTGGPVIRKWWSRFYHKTGQKCPMSHLVMLAPANFGSALAQLGKSRVSRIKAWMEGVEPGQAVLDWLELGSRQAWDLNQEWIYAGDHAFGPDGVFPFILTGQSIDRKFYDNLNPYTGELGSDGVIRVAAANLNAQYIRIEQGKTKIGIKELEVKEFKESPVTAFRIISGKSHSGTEMGILAGVRKGSSDKKSAETVKAIFDCLKVATKADYNSLVTQFADETTEVQKKEYREIYKGTLFKRTFIHSRFSQVIFKLVDTDGNPVTDFDLLFTGPDDDPNHLPEGFFADRQQNRLNKDTVTYFFNYDIMIGEDVFGKSTNKVKQLDMVMGLVIRPRPADGFVRFVECRLDASLDYLEKALRPNTTTLLEIVLQRNIDQQVFRLEKLDKPNMPSKEDGDFSKVKPGNETVN